MKGKRKHTDKIEWLSSYKERCEAARAYDSKIAELRVLGLSSKPLTGMPRGGGVHDVTERYVKIVTLEDKYTELKEKAFNDALQIVETIEGLKNAKYRLILRKRFIDGQDLNRIAEDMGITPEYACRIQGEALEKIELPNN